MQNKIINYDDVNLVNNNIIIKMLNDEIKTKSGLLIKSGDSQFFSKAEVCNFDTQINENNCNLKKGSIIIFKKGNEQILEKNYYLINSKDLILIS